MFSTFFAPRRNPVVPEMPGRKWGLEPGVHVGHHALPDTRAAVHIAEAARAGRGEKLGTGNFGTVYRVDTAAGTFAVKFPADVNIHGQAWDPEVQIRNFKHEAGVANTISRMGYADLMPDSRYVELHDGQVAIVREYGEPVTGLSIPEFVRLEEMLTTLDRKHFWEPHDDLQLYRRADGSVYVADVGFWHKRRGPGDRRSAPSSNFSSLKQTAKEFVQRGIREVPVLGELLYRIDRIRRDRRGVQGGSQWRAEFFKEDLKTAVAMVRKRDEYELPVPPAVRKYVNAVSAAMKEAP